MFRFCTQFSKLLPTPVFVFFYPALYYIYVYRPIEYIKRFIND